MRKFMLAAALPVLAGAVLAAPASAFDHHFSVVAKPRSSHGVGRNAFVFKDRLFDPHSRHDKVGSDRGKCRQKHGGPKTKCRIRVHLNGEIGGFGDIRVKGDLDTGPDHFVVIGGSDEFDGVAGKLTVHTAKRIKYHFDLVR